MSDINNVVLSGRLTRDAELGYTPGGTAVMDIAMCSNRVWNKDGERKEEAVFIDVTLWGTTAESIAAWMKKGKYIFVEGRLKFDSWESDAGRRTKLTVTAEKINFPPKNTGGSADPNEQPVSAGTNNEPDEDAPF